MEFTEGMVFAVLIGLVLLFALAHSFGWRAALWIWAGGVALAVALIVLDWWQHHG